MKIAGIDPSTRTGYVVLDEKAQPAVVPREWQCDLDGIDRVAWLFQTAYDELSQLEGVQMVVVEGYAHGAKFGHHHQVAFGTAVRLAIHTLGIPWVEVQPSSLKKFILGKGKGEKDMIMMRCLQNWGFAAQSNNIADAYGLARIGLALMGVGVRQLDQAQLDVISGLKRK